MPFGIRQSSWDRGWFYFCWLTISDISFWFKFLFLDLVIMEWSACTGGCGGDKWWGSQDEEETNELKDDKECKGNEGTWDIR